jgi:hypothetical protein
MPAPEPPQLDFREPPPIDDAPIPESAAQAPHGVPPDDVPDMSELADALRRAERDPAQPPVAPAEPAVPLHQRLAAALPEEAPQPVRAPPAPKRPSLRLGPAAARPAPKRPTPDFSGLPPAMAQSLAKLAGVPWPPQSTTGASTADTRQLEQEGAVAPAATPRRET